MVLMLGVRRGLPVDIALITLLVAYAGLFVCLALAVEILIADPLRRTLVHPIAAVAPLLLAIVFFGSRLWLFAAFAGLAAWLVRARGRVKRLPVQPALVVWLGVVLCAVIAIGLYGIAGHQHGEMQAHFLMPEYGYLGLLHKDPLSFVTFAAEMMSGRWPGPALDGIPVSFYHYGAHAVFASLTLAAGSSPFDGYMAAQQLVFIPVAVFYAGLAASALARSVGASVRTNALSVAIASAAVLVVPTWGWLNVFQSQSSTMAVPLTFMMLPLAATWLGAPSGPPRAIGPTLWLVAITLACVPFKVSTAMTVASMAGYLILRQLLSKRLADAVVIVAFVVTVGLAIAVWPTVFGHPFVIQWTGAEAEDEAVRAAYALAVALALLLACAAAGCELDPAREVWRMLLITCPVNLVWAWLIANEYHPYVSRYLPYGVLLLTLPLIGLALAALIDAGGRFAERRISVVRLLALPVVAVLVVVATWWGMEKGRAAPSRAVATISAAIGGMCRGVEPVSACRAAAPRAFARHSPDFVAALREGTGPRILATARQSPLPDAFFVPPANEVYWRFASGGNRPFENLTFLPAHFGVPMLLGLPPLGYGQNFQEIIDGLTWRYRENARSRSLSDNELCEHARRRNVARVAILESPDAVRQLDCRPLK
jgi:hypothetical protein